MSMVRIDFAILTLAIVQGVIGYIAFTWEKKKITAKARLSGMPLTGEEARAVQRFDDLKKKHLQGTAILVAGLFLGLLSQMV